MVALVLSPLFTAAQIRAADSWTIAVVGVPGLVLMEHAGRAVADVVAARLQPGGRVLIVCGRGNNGGDGFVCARHLAGRGVPVRVLVPQEPAGGDALTALQLLRTATEKKQLPVEVVVDVDAAFAEPSAVIVDALFGTGISRALEGESLTIVAAIAKARAASALVVAVDLPSGLPTDGQRPGSDVVVADVTVTFAGRKIAHLSEPGCEACGVVVDVDIGLLHPPTERCSVFALDDVGFPSPALLAHKGGFGHVGVVEGSPRMVGASRLAARAALRAGAGRVTLLGEGTERISELMAGRIEDAAGVDVVVVGPGLDASAVPVAALVELHRHHKTKIVADAGAIGVLVRGQAHVWTPHAGEAGRVLGCTSLEVQADRIAAARALVDKLGGVVVLKGAQPVVASAVAGGHRCVIVDGRAPALAVGGSGDVLAGIIGAVMAGALGSCSVDDAVVAAVWWHQQAGRRLKRGALASEIADALPAVRAVRDA
ncbi:MAG: NAD(P)H-hydrate epimerase [Deltaproteobacteria bacterium]|nr:NAD(P)H-hydrate epimerase [Deltaproteobacteria bacterium]